MLLTLLLSLSASLSHSLSLESVDVHFGKKIVDKRIHRSSPDIECIDLEVVSYFKLKSRLAKFTRFV